MWWGAFRGCWGQTHGPMATKAAPALCSIIRLEPCVELGRQESGRRGRSVPGQDGLQQLGPRVRWRTCCPAQVSGMETSACRQGAPRQRRAEASHPRVQMEGPGMQF